MKEDRILWVIFGPSKCVLFSAWRHFPTVNVVQLHLGVEVTSKWKPPCLTQVRSGDHVQVSVHRYEDRRRLVWCQNIRIITGIAPGCEPHVIGVRKHNTIYAKKYSKIYTKCVDWITCECQNRIIFYGGSEWFFKKILEDQSFLWATDTPVLGFWWCLPGPLGFKASVVPLACVLYHLCAMESSDSPLVQHLLTCWWSAWQLSHSDPHTCEQALVGLESRTFRVTLLV